MGYMNTEIMNKLDALLKEWIKAKYKSNNPTGTYSEGTLIEFMEEIANWTFQWYSAEAREAMPTETQESYDEWLEQNKKSTRNFIRKWGHYVKHDDQLYPIVPPKYNIGLVVKNCTEEMLNSLEPWCDRIYTDWDHNNYITKEQPNTKFNLEKRIFSINADVLDDIEVRIDGLTLTQNDYKYITELATIIKDSEISEKDFGSEFEVGHLQIMVKNLNTYEKDLVVCKR